LRFVLVIVARILIALCAAVTPLHRAAKPSGNNVAREPAGSGEKRTKPTTLPHKNPPPDDAEKALKMGFPIPSKA